LKDEANPRAIETVTLCGIDPRIGHKWPRKIRA